ncbi:matrixin family metalloprotease [Chryseobacterium sp. L7]|uniref:Matrixin family metalloprotease n=1 Tax=Chryseobacterium endalhagicum TaxID=2797638 RepID=A0ABS1QA41_9FLAO|nr:matrixin family metalloprotease [Chryseobacterium endalhagicum]MBL1219473.1 matrixin family metalloprotease [Chryseobacterium endalhagicum]
MDNLEISSNPFELQTQNFLPSEDRLHIYGNHTLCITDHKAYKKSLTEIFVNASEGFIPLWEENVTLNWRFDKSMDTFFAKPELAKEGIRKLFSDAILSWEDACPVKFSENDDLWDFEITVLPDRCNGSSCVLASAFFPKQGQDTLVIYPKLFTQSYKEQVETIIHEMGHIFGLRHFFAQIEEKEWRSEAFGKNDDPFSIMNYGDKSTLTVRDKSDLKELYRLVWSKKITQINRTPIKLFKPYHVKQ